jgi:hypothetical protein
LSCAAGERPANGHRIRPEEALCRSTLEDFAAQNCHLPDVKKSQFKMPQMSAFGSRHC